MEKGLLQNEATENHPENTRRRKHLHKENKEQNSILTTPQKRSSFIEKITHEGKSSECREEGKSS
ncbi:hypothetical protein C922_05142 [Plasmodium inui San Antonio 1]|uniref:Uncharacterized protein n=1 Tax=Plasmodium inui San Antonio 1 TaxID=1237626 RepID=W7A5W3_9APIC|nr:hypothetical protein C922_05142 [Plasmodium inui San Antonio 1]EUD64479.1 hypothetical protein C922_05142 [Plasmodium inui San Antonio 1]